MHYCGIVFVPPGIKDIEKYIDKRMAPYDENRGVDELVVPGDPPSCWCSDTWNVAMAAQKEWEKENPMPEDTLDERKEWWKKADLVFSEAGLKHISLGKVKYNEDCDTCGGTGIPEEDSQYNPYGHWDWYQIGGRWSGAISDYDPESNEDNIEKCYWCEGTGITTADVAKRHPAYEDNVGKECCQCKGKGRKVKWPTAWVTDMNNESAPIHEINKREFIPYFIITPDGRWQSKETLTPFRWVRGTYIDDSWSETVKGAYETWPNYLGVVVDCHS